MAKHTHKFQKKRLGMSKETLKPYFVWACVLSGCSTYYREELIVGKDAICWICGKTFQVYRDSNGILARPHCKSCTKKKVKEEEEFPALPPLRIPNIMP